MVLKVPGAKCFHPKTGAPRNSLSPVLAFPYDRLVRQHQRRLLCHLRVVLHQPGSPHQLPQDREVLEGLAGDLVGGSRGLDLGPEGEGLDVGAALGALALEDPHDGVGGLGKTDV